MRDVTISWRPPLLQVRRALVTHESNGHSRGGSSGERENSFQNADFEWTSAAVARHAGRVSADRSAARRQFVGMRRAVECGDTRPSQNERKFRP